MAFPFAAACLLALGTLLGPRMLFAQGTAAQGTAARPAATARAGSATGSTAAHSSGSYSAREKMVVRPSRRVRRRPVVHRHAALHDVKRLAAAQVPTPPPAPPKPNWPVNLPPSPATITWDSRGLAIDASNSSLKEILHEVGLYTGVKVQGFDSNLDQRIFGSYGPGPAREVLSKLLYGCGYDVVMVGGQGDEPPQTIILSKRGPLTPQPATSAAAETSYDQGYAGNQPAYSPQPFGGFARTPEQIEQQAMMREQMIQRTRQIRQAEQAERAVQNQ